MSLIEVVILGLVAIFGIAIGLWVFWKVVDTAIGTVKILSWVLAFAIIIAVIYFGWLNIDDATARNF